ncbi:MAG: hypothetical protein GY898_16310 [Proteobacteria bacterium]|nr:hypothetical protein [Pseudomonadota bacterium]
MSKNKWAAIAEGEESFTDPTHSPSTSREFPSESPRYAGAREMAEFLRMTARVIKGMARGFAVVCLLAGLGLFFFGPWMARNVAFLLVVPAVIVWVIAGPLEIIYRGLGDLTDAHLDLVTRSSNVSTVD